MAFVANPLEQFHRRMIEAEPQWFAFTRPVNLLEFLRQPDDRDFSEAELLQFRARHAELPFATIYQDEVGQSSAGVSPASRFCFCTAFLQAGRLRYFNFGLAQQYFQDAVESTPNDATAWIGLAASYDRLGRFDLADRAYSAAVKLAGNTASILNNEGYSHMLRGEPQEARAMFQAALKLEPNNPTTINNLKLLNSSLKYVERAANGEPCGSVDCGQSTAPQ